MELERVFMATRLGVYGSQRSVAQSGRSLYARLAARPGPSMQGATGAQASAPGLEDSPLHQIKTHSASPARSLRSSLFHCKVIDSKILRRLFVFVSKLNWLVTMNSRQILASGRQQFDEIR